MKQQRGLTLLETMLTIAIIAIVVNIPISTFFILLHLSFLTIFYCSH